MEPFAVTVANEGDTYRTIVAARQHQLTADEPIDRSGTDTGPTPGELLLASLGTCAAMTVRMYARRKDWPLAEVRVRLRYEEDYPEPDTTVIRREIELTGNLDEQQRQRLQHIGQACPVHRMLTHRILILPELPLPAVSTRAVS